MEGSLWFLNYQIEKNNFKEYISWFHNYHIIEKLNRPGYNWAAHYQVQEINLGVIKKNFYEFVGFFGGKDTQVFLDPSPSQLKKNQSIETRQMMKFRNKSLSLML